MKLAIDPGHGMGNRTPGVYDPGAVNQAFQEADIVLRYSLALEVECVRRGVPCWMTRRDATTPAPLSSRVGRAAAEGCTVLVSLHCNAALLESANGTETLYSSAIDLATRLQTVVGATLGLRNRGIKYRSDLAVLRARESALIELGFVSNVYDLAVLMRPEMPGRVAAAICGALEDMD